MCSVDDGTAGELEARALAARFRDVAGRWALDAQDAARLLRMAEGEASDLLAGTNASAPPDASEHRMRIAVEVDRAMRRAFQIDFNALVWLRLAGSPSRLERLLGDLPDMRAVRREAEELAA